MRNLYNYITTSPKDATLVADYNLKEVNKSNYFVLKKIIDDIRRDVIINCTGGILWKK